MARVLAVVGAALALASPVALAACGGKGDSATASTPTVIRHRRLPANAIRIQWKKSALVPAARAGRICVVTLKTGDFCATYAAGEIPAVAMKRELHSKGWVVVEPR